jgi:hypothetical protein
MNFSCYEKEKELDAKLEQLELQKAAAQERALYLQRLMENTQLPAEVRLLNHAHAVLFHF